MKEHENLAFKDRQRWMRQKEEREIKRQLDQGSSLASQVQLQPSWEPLVGERNLDDILSMLVSHDTSQQRRRYRRGEGFPIRIRR